MKTFREWYTSEKNPASEGELNDADFLKNLAKRIWEIPVQHGVDQYDSERLRDIADKIPNGPPWK
ncbi:MAG: hypothetical protein ACXADB_07270 [Candidatus Hermodarchaeia archaeon]|jgi:hypothetical protein